MFLAIFMINGIERTLDYDVNTKLVDVFIKYTSIFEASFSCNGDILEWEFVLNEESDRKTFVIHSHKSDRLC